MLHPEVLSRGQIQALKASSTFEILRRRQGCKRKHLWYLRSLHFCLVCISVQVHITNFAYPCEAVGMGSGFQCSEEGEGGAWG